MKKISGEQIKDLYRFLAYEAGAPIADKHFETIRLLTEDKEENVNMFRKILTKRRGFTSLAISEYRKELRKQGRGYVSSIEIIDAYNKDNMQQLKQLFSELLLEYIFDWEMDDMEEKIKKGKTSIEKIYKNYIEILEQGETCRFLYLINKTV